jgi:hypothetical protein
MPNQISPLPGQATLASTSDNRKQAGTVYRLSSCMKRVGLCALLALPAVGQNFNFSTGDPDGRMATASRIGSGAVVETESADDFLLSTTVSINHASFTGLLPAGVSVSDINQVKVEISKVFPNDSTVPPSGNVPTRVNSPSDSAFTTRDSAAASLTFASSILNPSFTALNSVLNGINKFPNQTTGGEGAVTGQEVRFDITFSDPLNLPADHYFFVPQVALTTGDFYWLSAPKPIASPGTPFFPDLQTWIQNGNLDPDWLRVGTDIVGGIPAPTFNASFTLSGTVPDTFSTAGSLGFTLMLLAVCARRVALKYP